MTEPESMRTRLQPRNQVLPAHAEESGVVVQAELVSAESRPQVGAPCQACGAPREGTSKFCTACGAPLETPDVPVVISGDSGSSADALPNHSFKCSNCGSEVATSKEQRSYVCPFCDSSYVTEIPLERTGRQRPEFVVGFAVSAQQAREKYFRWLGKNAWFRPGDLARTAVAEKQRGVYLPFWHFSMLAESRWSASIGECWYRTETYTTKDAKGKTVTRTRRVRETEWFPLSGRHHQYYSGYLVPATQGITAKEASAIQPYQLSALARYRPYFLAGWMAEEYSIAMDAAIELSKAEFRRRQEVAVARFLPGDTHRSVSVKTQLKVNGSDLVLLPVHVLSYRYRDRIFRFLVNGQTGKTIGEKPWSVRRVGGVVAVIVLLIGLLVALLFFMAGQ